MAMVVADLGLVKPSTYGELGVLLGEEDILEEEDAELIRRVAATRNLFAQAYQRIETGDLIEVADNLLPKVRELCKDLINFVKDSDLDPETTCSPSWAKAFEKNGVKLAYLFGSRARATSRESSDYDFAVLLDRDVTVEPQVGLTLDLADAFGVSVDKVDVVLLDEAELELVYRVLKEGRLVYKSGEDVRRRWERKALIKTLESKDLYHIYMKRIRTPKRHHGAHHKTVQK